VRSTPDRVVARIEAAYRRAAAGRPARRWTLKPPPGWPVSPTLDEQLDLAELRRQLTPG
jgi:hypothetical protein